MEQGKGPELETACRIKKGFQSVCTLYNHHVCHQSKEHFLQQIGLYYMATNVKLQSTIRKKYLSREEGCLCKAKKNTQTK